MTQKVLVFGGTQQSGKSTAAKFVVALLMKLAGRLRDFELDDDGNLEVMTGTIDVNGKIVEGKGILDLYRNDYQFVNYALERIWPVCKIYNFAYELKMAACNIFSLNPVNVFGTNEQKDTPTHIKYIDIAHLLTAGRNIEYAKKYNFNVDDPPTDLCISHRDLMQDFGTGICRQIDQDCWVNACWNKIKAEGYEQVIIDDMRFESEVDTCRKNGAYLTLLTRNPFPSEHASEQILKIKRKKFDYVLDNANLTLQQKNDQLITVLQNCGWITTELT